MRQVEWQQAALGFGGVQLCLAKQLTSSMSKLECGLEAKNSFVPTESWHAGSRSSLVSSESSHCAPESSRAPDPCISLLVVLHLATWNSQAKYPKGRKTMSKSWPPEKQVLLQWLWLKGCFTAQCYGNPPGMFIWEVPPICSHLLKIKQQRKNTKKQQLKQTTKKS